MSSGFCSAICGGRSGSGTPPSASIANRLRRPERLEMKYSRPSTSCGSRNCRAERRASIRFAVRPWSDTRLATMPRSLPGCDTQTISAVPDMNGPMTDSQSERRARFDELFSSYSRDIAAYCSWRGSAGSDPEDAVAEVFLAAWRRLDELPAGDAARVWLYATARRVLANQRRAQRRRFGLLDRLAQQPATPPTDESDEHARLHAALRRPGKGEREVPLLAEGGGMSPKQIAKVVGCPAVTARGRLHRARRRFRSAYEELHERDQPSVSSMQRLRMIDEHI